MNIINEIVNGKILEIHGEFGSGKTNLAMYLAKLISKKTFVFFIFTEDFPFTRFKKLCDSNNIFPMKISNFLDLYETIKKLINNGVIIVDSITYFYRINKDDFLLEEILKKLKLNKYGSILINQVRDNIDKNRTIPIGWHKLSKYVDIVFELKKDRRSIIITKPIFKKIPFEITDEGILIYDGK